MSGSVAPVSFRADHVGSLLRPQAVHSARKKHHADELDQNGFRTCDELRAIEDQAITDIVRMQERIGLEAVTDGEIRRSFWHYDFLGALTGFELIERNVGVQFHGENPRAINPTITGRLDFPEKHPMIEHFSYLANVASVQAKISIPGPSTCHYRTAPEDISPPEYADREVFFTDLTNTYKKAVQAFYDAGCRYLQMDDIFFAYLCDPNHREEKRRQGIDPDWLIEKYAKTMHDAIEDRPEDMLIGMHLCRGNFKSTWAAEGAYDLVADPVFNQTGVDIFFMEYDSDRAGGLEPLRLLPKGHQRVLPGFITTKGPELETLDQLKRKFDEASKYADIDQLGIAPQCGFASTQEGNAISFDDQQRKLERVVETAEFIWGGVKT